MDKLKVRLNELMTRLDNEDDLRSRLPELISIYPFNEYEFIISHLLATQKLSLDEYHQLRDEYTDRNLYLNLFEIMAPRSFGEAWAQGHLKELIPVLQKPNRRIDPEYSGQYDFFLPPKIRIEVKASRAVDFNVKGPLYSRALSSDSGKQFDMNFQQVKPSCCDVFVWLAVWRDVIMHWVLPSYDVENNPYYSRGQHRGNVGEGQLHINRENIRGFEKYLVEARDIESAIIRAYTKETQLRNRKA